MNKFLQETALLNFNDPAMKNIVPDSVLQLENEVEKAKGIYLFVRDNWLYSPYCLQTKEAAFKASNIVDRKEGHCIDKAILMVSFCRLAGIPARLRFARVRNHIATGKFEEFIKTNDMVPHGIVELYLNEKWMKCTPAFNKSLCDKLNVAVLEFDGENDSLFQQFDRKGDVFMEYMEDYGCYDDVPVDFIVDIMRQYYPHIFDENGMVKNFDEV